MLPKVECGKIRVSKCLPLWLHMQHAENLRLTRSPREVKPTLVLSMVSFHLTMVSFFGYLAVTGYTMARERGFQDGFQYTLLQTLTKRGGGVFGKFGKGDVNMNWHLEFDDVAAANADKSVSDELREIGGTV